MGFRDLFSRKSKLVFVEFMTHFFSKFKFLNALIVFILGIRLEFK